eukprot:403332000
MQEQQNQFINDKTIQEKDLLERQDKLIEFDKAVQEREKLAIEQINQANHEILTLKEEYDQQLLQYTQNFENQLKEKEDTINKIKILRDQLDNEKQQELQRLQEDNSKYEMQITSLQVQLSDTQISERSKDDFIQQQQEQINDFQVKIQQLSEEVKNAKMFKIVKDSEGKVDSECQCDLMTQSQSNEILINQQDQLKKLAGQDQKYHLLKKKLKKQKELNEKQSDEMKNLLQQVEVVQQQLIQKSQDFNKSENKLRELEVSLSKADNNIKILTNQLSSLDQQKQNYEENLKTSNEEKSQMQQDLESLISYKQEMDKLVDQMNTKLERKRAKGKYMKETIEFREQELDKKELVLRKVSQSAEDAQKQLKLTSLKLRQIEQTKLKDLKRQIIQQESLINDLNAKLKQLGNANQDSSFNNSHSRQTLKGKASRIQEVDEDLESTQRHRKFKGLTNVNSIDDLRSLQGDNSKISLLPEIQIPKSLKGQASIQNSIERVSSIKRGAFSNQQSYQDSYERQVDQFISKVKDPTYKNNSNGMQGVFSSSVSAYQSVEQFKAATEKYDYAQDGGMLSSRDKRVKEILESTEPYDKLVYFTPEKQLLTNKISNSKRIGLGNGGNLKLNAGNNQKNDSKFIGSLHPKTVEHKNKSKAKNINKL